MCGHSIDVMMIRVLRARFFCSDAARKTPLYELHMSHGGQLTNFAGYLLPVRYTDQTIVDSHHFTRNSASLFDVSHMLQTDIIGTSAAKFLETLTPADIRGMPIGNGALTVFTNATGGILDDLIVSKMADQHLVVVSNAARKVHDMQHLQTHAEAFPGDVRVRFYETAEKALMAVQGPRAAEALQPLLADLQLDRINFMQTRCAQIAGVDGCRLSRCGYTGEDGFEIATPADQAVHVAKALLERDGLVKLAGLGARDSLRLEAGLCLYGNDINEHTSIVEARLSWLVAKSRRRSGGFPGAKCFQRQLTDGVTRQRVGLIVSGSSSSPPARAGCEILTDDGKLHVIGRITSGCPSPSLGRHIAMGYIRTEFAAVDTVVQVRVRGRPYRAHISRMPFMPSHYYRGGGVGSS